ncbi:MAG: histidine phosphatase family protein [Bacillota bacterium]|nr:histidine phosphatase family protein [Bacillota bacterium]
MCDDTVVFYLVRHGQTVFNKKNRVQGWCDSPLSELGIQQAKDLGKNWDISHIQIAYSSTSERAVDTRDYVVSGRIPCFEHKGFKEINFGNNEGEKVEDVFPQGTIHIRSYEYVNGEHKELAAERFFSTMRSVAQSCGCQHIMIVAHGSIIRELLCQLSEYYCERELPTFKMVPNCSVTTIGLKNGEFYLVEPPRIYK